MSYVNGAEWKQDDCVTCYCAEGQVYCRAELCLVHCDNPRTVPGQCCPICDGTRFVSKCEFEATSAPRCLLLNVCACVCARVCVRLCA